MTGRILGAWGMTPCVMTARRLQDAVIRSFRCGDTKRLFQRDLTGDDIRRTVKPL